MVMALTLALAPGCGGGGNEGDSATAEVRELETKATQGDPVAAMALAEKLAAKTKNKEAQIEALKWFHVAGRLGNANAKFGIEVLQKNLGGDDVMEAERRAAAVKLPTK